MPVFASNVLVLGISAAVDCDTKDDEDLVTLEAEQGNSSFL